MQFIFTRANIMTNMFRSCFGSFLFSWEQIQTFETKSRGARVRHAHFMTSMAIAELSGNFVKFLTVRDPERIKATFFPRIRYFQTQKWDSILNFPKRA